MTMSVTRLYFTTQQKTCKTKTETRAPNIFSLFSALRMTSPETIILYYCGSQKNEKFLAHSITSVESITVNLVMLFDVFLVYETKFIVGKWQVVVFTAGKRRGRWREFGKKVKLAHLI